MSKFIEVTTVKQLKVLLNTEHIKSVERLLAQENLSEKTLITTTIQELPRWVVLESYDEVKKLLTT